MRETDAQTGTHAGTGTEARRRPELRVLILALTPTSQHTVDWRRTELLWGEGEWSLPSF